MGNTFDPELEYHMNGLFEGTLGERVIVAPAPAEKPEGHEAIEARKGNVLHVKFGK